jgi:pre-mRNA-processing factor SLU7
MKPPFEIDENNIKEMVDHMPQYIIRAPWYATGGLEEITTLKHQKLTDEERNRWTPITSHVERGFYHNNVYKYRKGACENCGAITHKTKECFERPRKIGARWTKNNFGNDEFIKPLMYKNDYEGKRDRWNGYDNSKELEKFKEYEIIEKQIELNENENNKGKKKLEEEVKEEDNQKKLKYERMQQFI